MARLTQTQWLELLDSAPDRAYQAKWSRRWVRQAASEVGLKVTARTPITPELLRDIADRRLAAREGLMSKSEFKQWLRDGWRISDTNPHIWPHVKLAADRVYLWKIGHGVLTWYIKPLTPEAAALAQKVIAKLYSD